MIDLSRMSKRQKLLIATGAGVSLVLGAFLGLTNAGHFIIGVSTVALRNDSDGALHDVSVTVTHSGEESSSVSFVEVRPQQMVRVPRFTSDLYLREIGCTYKGKKLTFTESGLACRGEVFIVSVDSSGRFTTQYER